LQLAKKNGSSQLKGAIHEQAVDLFDNADEAEADRTAECIIIAASI
jgi:hypothetical protein